jgi:hypothetical protein
VTDKRLLTTGTMRAVRAPPIKRVIEIGAGLGVKQARKRALPDFRFNYFTTRLRLASTPAGAASIALFYCPISGIHHLFVRPGVKDYRMRRSLPPVPSLAAAASASFPRMIAS